MQQIRVCTYAGPGTQPVIRTVPWPEIPKKAALIKGASELLRDVLNKPFDSTFVIIEEIETDNWGWGGLPTLDSRLVRAATRS